ncbi:MAG TPA: 50S ribosomal protein L18 [Clostridia bacterium]|nr:50S ribosomal protein L18 [Clostridia bacterium]
MLKKPSRNKLRGRRHLRVRRKVYGTEQRPRLGVYRSSKHIYAQIINDDAGVSLVAASSLSPELKDEMEKGCNIKAAEAVGRLVAEKALARGLKKVTFDRGGYIYHGRIKALADGAREAGLEF